MRNFIIQNVCEHLVCCGFSQRVSAICAQYAWEFYDRSLCNSRNPYKDCCDHAGAKAQTMQIGVKYKSPRAKSKPRSKKPQDAFNFGDI